MRERIVLSNNLYERVFAGGVAHFYAVSDEDFEEVPAPATLASPPAGRTAKLKGYVGGLRCPGQIEVQEGLGAV